MPALKVEGVTHWSIPVNDLEESEAFYSEVLGLEYKGRLGTSGMSCFEVGGHSILLCRRNEPVVRTPEQENRLHHSFTVSPETFEAGARLSHERGIPMHQLVYRELGFFTGRELYFLDPSGNLLELRDPAWTAGMPTPTLDELIGTPSIPASAEH